MVPDGKNYCEHGIPGDGGVQKRRIASTDQYFPSAMAPLFPHSARISHPFPFSPSTRNLARRPFLSLLYPPPMSCSRSTLKFAHRPSFSSSRESRIAPLPSTLSFFTLSGRFNRGSPTCQYFYPLICLSRLTCSRGDENGEIMKSSFTE